MGYGVYPDGELFRIIPWAGMTLAAGLIVGLGERKDKFGCAKVLVEFYAEARKVLKISK